MIRKRNKTDGVLDDILTLSSCLITNKMVAEKCCKHADANSEERNKRENDMFKATIASLEAKLETLTKLLSEKLPRILDRLITNNDQLNNKVNSFLQFKYVNLHKNAPSVSVEESQPA